MNATRTDSRPHIFVSFKTEERLAAIRLKDALTAAGYRVWWQEDIQCGREWHGDLDGALARAGCVVVLWSTASMKSPWVRHEASQAIARGIYTPARLEPIEIDSPYDRIQATDLLNWTGDGAHPGLTNLLKRVDELLPPPVPFSRRLSQFARRHTWTFLSLVFAAVATALLVQLSSNLNVQVARQAEISRDIQRTLQPLDAMEVRVFATIDSDAPGMSDYVRRLRDTMLLSRGGSMTLRDDLPPGASWSRKAANGTVEAVRIEPQSPMWPANDSGSRLDYVMSHVELGVDFRRPQAPAAPDVAGGSRSLGRTDVGDLSFEIRSYALDKSEPADAHNLSLQWEPTSGALSSAFTDAPPKKYWISAGTIVSVPDLESSVLTVKFRSVFYPSFDEQTITTVLKGRRHLRVSSIFLGYAGRELMIRGSDMTETIGDKGLRTYSINMAEPAVQRVK